MGIFQTVMILRIIFSCWKTLEGFFSMINSGFSLREIIDSKPTKKYDLIYEQSKFITPNDFEAVYYSLT
jgi:hypothetical protein